MSPGPLALVGGDELKAGNEPQDRVLTAAAGDGPAFVLATAAARQGPATAVRNAQRWFLQLGLDVQELPVLQPAEAESPEVAARAAGGRFFYLVGGDPGHTVGVLRGSAVWAAIADAWRGGAALGGSSAGAMALGEWSLVREAWPNRSSRRYADALGLVRGVAVLPHFQSFGGKWVDSAQASAPREDVTLLGVDERTAALWQDGRWRVAGLGNVTVIAGSERRAFEPGEPIEGLPAPG